MGIPLVPTTHLMPLWKITTRLEQIKRPNRPESETYFVMITIRGNLWFPQSLTGARHKQTSRDGQCFFLKFSSMSKRTSGKGYGRKCCTCLKGSSKTLVWLGLAGVSGNGILRPKKLYKLNSDLNDLLEHTITGNRGYRLVAAQTLRENPQA